MKPSLQALALVAGMMIVPVLQAQEPTVLLMEKIQAEDRSELPGNGLTMDQVRAQYGEPLSVRGPVGEPPINTWVYQGFNVYFEDDRVIDSVCEFKRKDEYAQQ